MIIIIHLDSLIININKYETVFLCIVVCTYTYRSHVQRILYESSITKIYCCKNFFTTDSNSFFCNSKACSNFVCITSHFTSTTNDKHSVNRFSTIKFFYLGCTFFSHFFNNWSSYCSHL